MTHTKRFSALTAQLGLAILISTGVGCSTMVEKKGNLFEPGQIDSMLFRFDQPPELLGTELPGSLLAERISGNLGEWGYPITTDDSIGYSHTVTISIGEVKRGSTPSGLSFSSGNSDPRALDFQKAEVLPITCFLIPRERPEQSAELTMMFTAKDYLAYSGTDKSQNHRIDRLVDDGSTVCFNLLRELKVKTQTPEHSENKTQPGWFPEIRVEVENDGKPENLERPPAEKKSEPNEPRKQVVIHNQGSPVIFKFGHERK